MFSAENQILYTNAGATYAYDGDGKRMKKVTASETTYTFYGPGGVISEFTTSNAIATATSASSTDKCFYHTSDKLGSAVLVMNSSGVVIENNRTLPYGEAWLAESTPTTNDKKFTTYQRDAESGLDYAMDRYYGNNAGRFESPDAAAPRLRKPITLNRYLYTADDPINYTDPTGQLMTIGGDDDGFGGGVDGYECTEIDALAFTTSICADPSGGIQTTTLTSHPSQPQVKHYCGVNPITGKPGINLVPDGKPGDLRPGRGGSGSGAFGVSRPANHPPIHAGIDIAGYIGENVLAALSGKVTSIGWMKGYGQTVVITDAHGYTYLYGHLEAFADLHVGDQVAQGTRVGWLGQTGNALGQTNSEAHVHFEVHNGAGGLVNAGSFLNSPCPWDK